MNSLIAIRGDSTFPSLSRVTSFALRPSPLKTLHFLVSQGGARGTVRGGLPVRRGGGAVRRSGGREVPETQFLLEREESRRFEVGAIRAMRPEMEIRLCISHRSISPCLHLAYDMSVSGRLVLLFGIWTQFLHCITTNRHSLRGRNSIRQSMLISANHDVRIKKPVHKVLL